MHAWTHTHTHTHTRTHAHTHTHTTNMCIHECTRTHTHTHTHAHTCACKVSMHAPFSSYRQTDNTLTNDAMNGIRLSGCCRCFVVECWHFFLFLSFFLTAGRTPAEGLSPPVHTEPVPHHLHAQAYQGCSDPSCLEAVLCQHLQSSVYRPLCHQASL